MIHFGHVIASQAAAKQYGYAQVLHLKLSGKTFECESTQGSDRRKLHSINWCIVSRRVTKASSQLIFSKTSEVFPQKITNKYQLSWPCFVSVHHACSCSSLPRVQRSGALVRGWSRTRAVREMCCCCWSVRVPWWVWCYRFASLFCIDSICLERSNYHYFGDLKGCVLFSLTPVASPWQAGICLRQTHCVVAVFSF